MSSLTTTVTMEQALTVIAFLSLMLGILLLVKRFRGGIVMKLQPERRIFVIEETPLGGQEKLRLVKVDDQGFLIVSGRGQAATVTPIGPISKSGAMTTADSSQQSKANARQQPGGRSQQASAGSIADHGTDTADTNPIAAAIRKARQQNPKLGLNS